MFDSSKNFEIPIYVTLLVLTIFSVLYRDDFFRNVFKYTIQEVVCAIFNSLRRRIPLSSGNLQKFMKVKWLQIIGLASYSIYLSHLVLINFLRNLDLFEFSKSYQWLEVLILFGICLLVGCILHYIADKPFEKYRRKFR
jgi:peptidoglycan/LPS O-acetylase OafA/YrhL